MKKISIITFGLLSFVALAIAVPYSVSSLARGGDDYIYSGLFVLLPAILVAFFVYRLIKNPKIYDNFRKTVYFSAIGIIITLSVDLATILFWGKMGADTGLALIIDTILGIIVSSILAIIGLLFDLKNRNRMINNNAKK